MNTLTTNTNPVHHIITKPSIDKITELNIIGPYFINSVYNTQVNDDNGITQFTFENQNYYYFTNRIRKTLIYDPSMLPTNFDNINTLFITEIMKL